ncbi:nucleotidyltransferase [Staphylococcus sp. 11261D007BR]
MKSVALITEYNPFHNGHLYHARQSKIETQSDIVIAIMSGQFMMRGELAMFNKFQRAQMALAGVDLVVELPLVGSLSSSDIFAEMGIKVADYMDADSLCFGSESGDIEALQRVAQQLLDIEQSPTFKQYLKEGKSYARIVYEQTNEPLLKEPNNTLGISYLKQLIQLQSPIQPYTISRLHTRHHQDELTHQRYASGSAIRNSIFNHQQDWQYYVPSDQLELYRQPFTDVERVFDFLRFTIHQNSTESLKSIYTIQEGLEHRIKKILPSVHNYDTFMQALKTKRYTYTHIQRVLMNILLNMHKEDVHKTINGVRILAMTSTGQHYLKQLKQNHPDRQYITNVNQKNAHLFKNEIKATHLYNCITHTTQNDFNTPVYIQK